jgi:hypothetical protein
MQVVVLQEEADAARPTAARKAYKRRFLAAMVAAVERDFQQQLNPRDPRVETDLEVRGPARSRDVSAGRLLTARIASGTLEVLLR